MSVYKKRIIEHQYLYIVSFIKNVDLPYVIFVHGGPGLNCGILEYLIENHAIFDTLNFNIILYDQRGCGRSKNLNGPVVHADNFYDLGSIFQTIIEQNHLNVAAVIGHSYGAKMVYDFAKNNHINAALVLVSTSSSILTPRINNLLLDLSYLKQQDPKQYQEILNDFDELNYEKLWELTERLNSVFQKNVNRPYLYWANLDWMALVESLKDKINLPINLEIFNSVRKDLYSRPEEYSIDIDSLVDAPCLLINGFHDVIINGSDSVIKSDNNKKVFNKSSHYPHIEEHLLFCEVVNNFMKMSRG